jgi:2-hydroxy-6-oxonona-2,4-dienedioate hydrolase
LKVTTTAAPATRSIWLDLLSAEVRYYDAAGVRTRSIECGSGETIIMLHGIGGHAEAFARNIVPLGQQFNARAIDYYGHGLTDYGGKPFVKDTYVRHLIDFMDAAGIEKAHLIGESLGGWIAAWTAIDYPERVGKVIYTVGAHLKVPIDEATAAKTQIGMGELIRLSKQFMAEPNRKNVHERLKWLFHKPDRDISEELIDLRWALYEQALSKPNPASSLGNAESELTPEVLARIPRPMLFLWSDHNPSQQVATAKVAMSYVKDADWALIEDAGHWPQWEHPDEFNRIVTAYLTK